MNVRLSRTVIFVSLFALIWSLTTVNSTASTSSWHQWVAQLRRDAIADGVRAETFDKAFADIKAPNKRVLHFDRTQPERRIDFYKYRNTCADNYRIKVGRREYRKHRALIDEISNKYGVSSCFIMSFWGLETSYGRFMGNFNVVKSLATLAYDDRRAAFFRQQLIYALHILDDGHVRLKDFKGEWAGASGQPQFLPSSWHHFALDYNGDGRKDIWQTHSDVFASIANYLVQHGWRDGEPWAYEVKLPADFNRDVMRLDYKLSVTEWERLGVQFKTKHPHLNRHLQAAVVQPDGGPVLMVFNNFDVIMKWNRSIYYAGTVGYMAEQICQMAL